MVNDRPDSKGANLTKNRKKCLAQTGLGRPFSQCPQQAWQDGSYKTESQIKPSIIPLHRSPHHGSDSRGLRRGSGIRSLKYLCRFLFTALFRPLSLEPSYSRLLSHGNPTQVCPGSVFKMQNLQPFSDQELPGLGCGSVVEQSPPFIKDAMFSLQREGGWGNTGALVVLQATCWGLVWAKGVIGPVSAPVFKFSWTLCSLKISSLACCG